MPLAILGHLWLVCCLQCFEGHLKRYSLSSSICPNCYILLGPVLLAWQVSVPVQLHLFQTHALARGAYSLPWLVWPYQLSRFTLSQLGAWLSTRMPWTCAGFCGCVVKLNRGAGHAGFIKANGCLLMLPCKSRPWVALVCHYSN